MPLESVASRGGRRLPVEQDALPGVAPVVPTGQRPIAMQHAMTRDGEGEIVRRAGVPTARMAFGSPILLAMSVKDDVCPAGISRRACHTFLWNSVPLTSRGRSSLVTGFRRGRARAPGGADPPRRLRGQVAHRETALQVFDQEFFVLAHQDRNQSLAAGCDQHEPEGGFPDQEADLFAGFTVSSDGLPFRLEVMWLPYAFSEDVRRGRDPRLHPALAGSMAGKSISVSATLFMKFVMRNCADRAMISMICPSVNPA